MSVVNYNPDVLSCLANLSNDEVFTPPIIANAILDMLPKELWTNPNTKILDPAVKSGVFLREAAKRLIKGLEPVFPDLQQRLNHIYSKQLFGIAITELTSYLARRSVYCSKTANGQYSIVQFKTDHGNIVYEPIQHSWDSNGRCIYCGASNEQYGNDLEKESHAYKFIHLDEKKLKEFFKEVKFDLIISNPPYQLSDGGAQASAVPIYQKFVEQAKKLNPRYITMIIPARWYTGGKGLDSFRSNMLEDRKIKEIHDFPKASDCFPSVEIKGGVLYFLWDSGFDNSKENIIVHTYDGNNVEKMARPFRYSGVDIFVRHGKSMSILNKVLKSDGFESLSNHVSVRKAFGIPGEFCRSKDFKKSPCGLNHPLQCYAKGMSVGYVEAQFVTNNQEYINRWKVFVPRANNIGMESPDDNLNSFVGGYNVISTESYMTVCADLDYSEIMCKNLATYLKTKFVRFCHMLMKASQDATAKTYSFVPMQDFSKPWTDEELYKKYELTEDEIEFIESMIKPMDVGV